MGIRGQQDPLQISGLYSKEAVDAMLEGERIRIAQEIHDGVSQNLALLMLKMEIISRLADSDPVRMRAELQKAIAILESSVEELRKSVDTLRSPTRPKRGPLV